MNQQANANRKAVRAGILAATITFALFGGWIAVRFGFDGPPSATGDEPSYDAIAWSLSHGDGFSIDYQDPEFRRPYDQAAIDAPDLFTLPNTPSGPVAFRPPLFPCAFALTDVVAGRQFYLIRGFNVLCIALTAGLIVFFLQRQFGTATATAVLLLFLMDTRTRLYARSVLTEPLACLLGTILTLLVLRYYHRSQSGVGVTILIGIAAGLSILTRSIALLWMPGLLALMYRISRRQHRQTAMLAVKCCAFVLAAVLVVISPWAARNTVLLKKFSPMGTQGQMELSAGYSDAAWESHGVWQNAAARGYVADAVTPQMSTIEVELAIASDSTAKAIAWAVANPWKLPGLAVMKVISELWPANWLEVVVLTLMVIGVAMYRHTAEVQICVALLLTNLFAVAATWSVEGRFMVPLLFATYTLAAAGLQSLLTCSGVRSSDTFPEPVRKT